MKRWTKETRVGVIHDTKGKEVEEDHKLAYMRRFRELCDKLLKLAAEVSHSEEETALFSKFLDEAMEKIRIFRLRRAQVANEISDPIAPSSMDMSQPTGIKKRQRKRHLKNSVKL